MVFTCTDTYTSMNMYVLHTQHTHTCVCMQANTFSLDQESQCLPHETKCAHDNNGGAISLALKVKDWSARAEEYGQLSNKAEQQR